MPPRRLRFPRASPRHQALQARTLDEVAAAGNARMAASNADRATIRQRLDALEARPLVTGGRAALTGLRGSVSVTVPLTRPMPDADYTATASFVAPAGLLTTAATISITGMTATAVTVQLGLGAAVLAAGAFVHVVAVKG